MKIVILDGQTLNPGDLSWDGLRALAPCELFPRTPVSEIPARCANADIIVTNKAPLSAATLAALPQLRFISVTATGHNIVDSTAARARGIPVSNVPAYGTRSVAQLTWALLLELAHHAGAHSDSVHKGDWAANADWCYWRHPLIELDGLTLGIIGYGRIGRAVAQLGHAFGMRVLVHTRTPISTASDPAQAESVSLEELLRRSDVVSLHCPLTPDTQHIINAERLSWMKPTALLLNTSRGPLIDEAALRQALDRGALAGAGLDVLSQEPPPANHPLFGAPRCIITPHLAWATQAARSRLMKVTVDNVRAFLAGQPIHVVNP